MTAVHFTAKVKESRLLELPEEAQELGLQPGEEVRVSVERNGLKAASGFPPNERGLAAMREIAERQKNRAPVVGSDVVKLVREAKAGGL